MLKDRYDKILCLLLALTIAGLCLVLWEGRGGSANRTTASTDKAMERELAYQARIALLQRLYAPVETLSRSGDYQSALFKLDEITRQYPSEAHGRILKGEILAKMGAPDEALKSYVEGVKLNGDYLDRKSPLSRRAEIEKVVDQGAQSVVARLKGNPENSSLAQELKDVNYLKSRLAGGCE